MPIETDPHERIYMAFPPLGELFGDTHEEALPARTAWSAVANATAQFLPVEMVVSPGDHDVARAMLSSEIRLHEAPLNEAWMRDIGPTFVVSDDGRLGAVDWRFNGWGQQPSSWAHDEKIAAFIAELAGVELVPSDLVNEGGGIHVDGRGTVFLTDTVQLDRFRNPEWSRVQIEHELTRTIGARNFIWFHRGLYRDALPGATRGHIDILAVPSDDSTVLLHRQTDPSHPDFHLYEECRAVLDEARTIDGEPWRVLDLPAPKRLRDEETWVDHSYVNHLVTNGAVIACTYADPNDEVALAVLAEAYPGREIVGIDARNIFRYGGGIHCITQQLPRV
ncbi:MAG: agmatine deiminase family protein [Leucobacter sp.]|nr:agmatine deiminase family protein [Leucobacter sp.]